MRNFQNQTPKRRWGLCQGRRGAKGGGSAQDIVDTLGSRHGGHFDLGGLHILAEKASLHERLPAGPEEPRKRR